MLLIFVVAKCDSVTMETEKYVPNFKEQNDTLCSWKIIVFISASNIYPRYHTKNDEQMIVKITYDVKEFRENV